MSTELAQLKTQNRLLKAGLAIGTMVLFFVAAGTQKTKYKEIDAERINILSPDGKVEMVISNRTMLPRAVIDGKEVADVRNMPGIIFYNDIGDECGGLIYSGKLDEKGMPASGMHFSMDRFGGDQQLALGHYEGNGFMESGLNVYDRGLVKDYAPLFEALKKAESKEEKEAITEKIEAAGGTQIQRAFFGKTRGKSSAVILADAKGQPRIMMMVTPEGQPMLMFLGDSGEPIYTLPPEPTEDAEKK